MTTRRELLAAAAGVGAGLAGCLDTGTEVPENADVVVGPNTQLTFDPETLTVSAGETVMWFFASASHNVSCVPEHSGTASLPEGAEPFASYDGDNSMRTEPRGATYEHTFETPGEYRYVCVPHAPSMAGTIRVEP